MLHYFIFGACNWSKRGIFLIYIFHSLEYINDKILFAASFKAKPDLSLKTKDDLYLLVM